VRIILYYAQRTTNALLQRCKTDSPGHVQDWRNMQSVFNVASRSLLIASPRSTELEDMSGPALFHSDHRIRISQSLYDTIHRCLGRVCQERYMYSIFAPPANRTTYLRLEMWMLLPEARTTCWVPCQQRLSILQEEVLQVALVTNSQQDWTLNTSMHLPSLLIGQHKQYRQIQDFASPSEFLSRNYCRQASVD
jgi:hypothetical protein